MTDSSWNSGFWASTVFNPEGYLWPQWSGASPAHVVQPHLSDIGQSPCLACRTRQLPRRIWPRPLELQDTLSGFKNDSPRDMWRATQSAALTPFSQETGRQGATHPPYCIIGGVYNGYTSNLRPEVAWSDKGATAPATWHRPGGWAPMATNSLFTNTQTP